MRSVGEMTQAEVEWMDRVDDETMRRVGHPVWDAVIQGWDWDAAHRRWQETGDMEPAIAEACRMAQM